MTTRRGFLGRMLAMLVAWVTGRRVLTGPVRSDFDGIDWAHGPDVTGIVGSYDGMHYVTIGNPDPERSRPMLVWLGKRAREDVRAMPTFRVAMRGRLTEIADTPVVRDEAGAVNRVQWANLSDWLTHGD